MPANQDSLPARPQPNPLAHLHFYGDEFLLDARTGAFFRLSSSALFILQKIADGNSVHELTRSMTEAFGIEEKLAVRDIELLINELVSLGILQSATARLK